MDSVENTEKPVVETPVAPVEVSDDNESSVISAVVASAGGKQVEDAEDTSVVDKPAVVTPPTPAVSAPVVVDFKAENERLQKELAELKSKPAPTVETPAPVVEAKAAAPAAAPWTPKGVLTEKDVDKLFSGGADTVEVINTLANNIREDLASLVLGYVQKEIVEKHIVPLQRPMQEAELNKHVGLFFEKHADLKKYEDIAAEQAAVISGEMKAGRKFKSWDEVYEEVSTRTRAKVAKLEQVFGVKPAAGKTPPVPNGNIGTPIKSAPVDVDDDAAAIDAVIRGSR